MQYSSPFVYSCGILFLLFKKRTQLRINHRIIKQVETARGAVVPRAVGFGVLASHARFQDAHFSTCATVVHADQAVPSHVLQ